MSDAHNHPTDSSEAHEGPIKTPKQLITAVVFAFVVPIIVIVLLVKFVVSQQRDAAGTHSLAPEAVAVRIQRVGRVDIKDPSAPKVLKTGQQVYAQCSACHASGAAGAPIVGNVKAWEARIKTGLDALVLSALKGKGAMAAQGGGELADIEIARAVVYMTNASGANFTEPAAP